MQRRTFLAVGAGGATLLAVAGWWSWSRLRFAPNTRDSAATIVRAVVPAMLDGALPADGRARAAAIDETVDGVAKAIAGLPPASRGELAQLFRLLDIDIARRALAGVPSPWHEAGVAEVSAFLSRWQGSGWALKRSAYDALHQLVFAAWYGSERSWPSIGYPGPPALA